MLVAATTMAITPFVSVFLALISPMTCQGVNYPLMRFVVIISMLVSIVMAGYYGEDGEIVDTEVYTQYALRHRCHGNCRTGDMFGLLVMLDWPIGTHAN